MHFIEILDLQFSSDLHEIKAQQFFDDHTFEQNQVLFDLLRNSDESS